jgi:cysteinyl-tRNA synthetase
MKKLRIGCRRYFSSTSCKRIDSVCLYDSLSGTLKAVQPDATGRITWYACGPTVYDSAHIGHARTYVSFDIIRRCIEQVLPASTLIYGMGITDVDDKIINKSIELNKSPQQVATSMKESFVHDMDMLNVRRPDVFLQVSDHINDIIKFIEALIAKGAAYLGRDGVYLNTYFPSLEYGKLAAGELNSGEEGGVGGDLGKKSSRDFALWKFQKSHELVVGESVWMSPWGPGRPGWHIECTSMIHSLFGPGQVSIHSGGIDLAFPHHCNELAQHDAFMLCEDPAHVHVPGEVLAPAAAPPVLNSPWVHTWMHSGHVHIAGAKMSKSLKNFITVADMFATFGSDVSATSDCFRYFCCSYSYRSHVTYSTERLVESKAHIDKIKRDLDSLLEIITPSISSSTSPKWKHEVGDYGQLETLANTRWKVSAALKEDMNFPIVLQELRNFTRTLFGFAETTGLRNLSTPLIVLGVQFLLQSYSMLGFLFAKDYMSKLESILGSHPSRSGMSDSREELLLEAIVDFRTRVRKEALLGLKASDQASKASSFKALLRECDVLRDETLVKLGWTITDQIDPMKR